MSEIVRIISPVDGSAMPSGRSPRRRGQRGVVRGPYGATQVEGGFHSGARALHARFLDALLAMNDDVAVELAWQMGRPVRYGGENSGVEERIRAMVAMADEALEPYYPPEKAGFRRYIAREPLGDRHGDRAVELSRISPRSTPSCPA